MDKGKQRDKGKAKGLGKSFRVVKEMEWYYNSSYVSLLLATTTIIVCITALLLNTRKRSDCKLLPPGPSGLPVIGHLHLLGKLPHQSLCELSKKHGPLMSLRLGSVPVVVASSPEMAREILQKHDLAFSNRPSTAAANQIYAGCKDIAFSPPNAHWRLMRRLCVAELVSTKGLNFFKPVRTEEIKRSMRWVLAESVDANACKPHQIRPKITQLNNDMMMRMMLGKRFSELECREQRAKSLVELIAQASKLLAAFNLGDFLPCIAWMDLQGSERRSKRLAADIRAAFEGIIHARRLAHTDDRQQPNDYLDMLLEASAASDAPIHIIEVITDLLGGGTESASFTIEWALAELLSNPEKMTILQAEIDEVVGRARVIQEEDIEHLPFLVACVKETMRLHPVGPLLVPRKTNHACEILGFHILANTQAYVNVWAIGRDPKVWENPTKFSPERFLGASCVDVKGHHFELLPFGAGRRICVGWRLGLLNVQIILASLLQGFEWSLPPSHHLDMLETFGLTTSLATPLVACTTPRLSKELY